MRAIAFGIAICAVCLTSTALAQSNLPLHVHMDMLLRQIETAVKAGNARDALGKIEQYRKLGMKMPPTLLFLEAKLAEIIKDYGHAEGALTEYLSLPEINADKNYAFALTLYPKIETKASEQAFENLKGMCGASPSNAALYSPGMAFRECAIAPETVVLRGGKFMMGSLPNENGRNANEDPQHRVSIRDFAIGKYEVTFDEWDACVAGGGCKAYRPQDSWGRGRMPVNMVSWQDSQAYVAWLSAVTGKHYRLPSEAEWEYAARAGTTTAYSFGKIYKEAMANSGLGTRKIGSYPANTFGLHDVHGNVSEWTQDCWNDDYQNAPIDGRAWTFDDCSKHVERGGSWITDAKSLRSASRRPRQSHDGDNSLGFRVARTLD